VLSGIEPLSAFISEALRLYPSTPIVARFAVDADSVDGDAIEAGLNVMVSFIGVQHDRRFRADPWAVALETAHAPAAGASTAFGHGPRSCEGKHFALFELMIFLSIFLARARFELTSDEPPTFRWKSQMLREGGQPLRLVAR
jgi:cytochrome P450